MPGLNPNSRNLRPLTVFALAVLGFVYLPDFPTLAAVQFSTHLAPIFVEKCLTCHNATKQKGKYRLDSFSALMQPGESKSPPVVPGKPEESRLYQLITAKDPDDRMPQKDDPLPPAQIAMIAQWIREGAQYDRSPQTSC